MVINEIFYSIQGEGFLAGVPSVFIRLAGCPLRCTWCDTKYALDPAAGDDLTIDQIINKINSASSAASAVKSRHVVITGGEPMVNPQLLNLTIALKELGKHITTETAAIAFLEGLSCDLMSISPKTSNSGTKKELDLLPVSQLIEHYAYQLKFVIDLPNDLPEIQQIIGKLGDIDKERVMLMPQAKTRDELIAKSPMVVDMCKKTGFTFCNRLQILLYNNAKGK